MKSPTASNWRSPKSNSRTPRKSNKGKAGNKRIRLATRTSTTIGRSDTIGLWNKRESSMFAWSPVLCRRDTAAVVQRSVPVLRYLEKVVHPRWHTPLKTTKRLVGTVVVILSATLVFIPIPLSNVVPALVIALISLAYVEEDGLLLLIALLAAVIVLTVELVAVWEMVIGAKWITGLW